MSQLQKQSGYMSEWYVTDNNEQAIDFVYQDFCNHLIITKTFASPETNETLLRTEVVVIDAATGTAVAKSVNDLEPFTLSSMEEAKFPLAR